MSNKIIAPSLLLATIAILGFANKPLFASSSLVVPTSTLTAPGTGENIVTVSEPKVPGASKNGVVVNGNGSTVVKLWFPSTWAGTIQVNANGSITITDVHATGQSITMYNVSTVVFSNGHSISTSSLTKTASNSSPGASAQPPATSPPSSISGNYPSPTPTPSPVSSTPSSSPTPTPKPVSSTPSPTPTPSPVSAPAAPANPPASATTSIPTGGVILTSGSYVSSAASIELPKLCTSHTESFPAQWTWDMSKTMNQPRAAVPADNLTPKIEQVRNGQVIATYTSFASNSYTSKEPGPKCDTNLQNNVNPEPAAASGCGPLGNTPNANSWRLWQDGDTFLVYPAVYTGVENNVFIGARGDKGSPTTYVPQNLTIKGVTQIINGEAVRPVLLNVPASYDYASSQGPIYIHFSDGIVIENIDVDGSGLPHGEDIMGGIYINGANNLTLRQMRVVGFDVPQANGVFGTGNNTGTLTLDQMELARDGGYGSSFEHNAYIGASLTDANFTVHMTNSWSHDAFTGHTFKSRAEVTTLEGNYFEGGLPQGGPELTVAENYLVDVPNGGRLTMKNNVLVKNASGYGENGISVTFAPEGIHDLSGPQPRIHSIDIENNTFVAFAQTFDGVHPLYPFFFYNHLIPGTAGFEIPILPSGFVVPPTIVAKNAFVGYCPAPVSFPDRNYRGDNSATVAFSEINQDFSFKSPVLFHNTSIVGTPAYAHAAQTGLTRLPIPFAGTTFSTIGAEDQ